MDGQDLRTDSTASIQAHSLSFVGLTSFEKLPFTILP